MPRGARPDALGVFQHVIIRGIEDHEPFERLDRLLPVTKTDWQVQLLIYLCTLKAGHYVRLQNSYNGEFPRKKGLAIIVANPLNRKTFLGAGRRNRTTDTGIFSPKPSIGDFPPFSSPYRSRLSWDHVGICLVMLGNFRF